MKKIQEICNIYKIENYTINPDGSIDVRGSVNISYKNLYRFPLKFGKVTGDFYCYNNRLKTLEGAPITVDGDFSCSNNQLKTLEGAPITVGGYFACTDNRLVSLEGGPQEVGGAFYCYNNRLVSLKGHPTKIEGYFHCDFIEEISKIPHSMTFNISEYIMLKRELKINNIIDEKDTPNTNSPN